MLYSLSLSDFGLVRQVNDVSVGTKYNYRPSTSIRVTSILSYTVLEDNTRNGKQSSKLVEAETQGLIM